MLHKIACETIYIVWKKGLLKEAASLMEITDFSINFISV